MKSDTASEAVARAVIDAPRDIHNGKIASAMSAADSAISAFTAWLQENGWQIVPKEPSEAMPEAGRDVACFTYFAIEDEGTIERDRQQCADIYRAMLSAAPKPETGR